MWVDLITIVTLVLALVKLGRQEVKLLILQTDLNAAKRTLLQKMDAAGFLRDSLNEANREIVRAHDDETRMRVALVTANEKLEEILTKQREAKVALLDLSRCAVCGWPLAVSQADGCVRGNCSMRPRPVALYDPERARTEGGSRGTL